MHTNCVARFGLLCFVQAVRRRLLIRYAGDWHKFNLMFLCNETDGRTDVHNNICACEMQDFGISTFVTLHTKAESSVN